MNKKSNKKFTNIKAVGNFTKHAIKNFEENIINQKDYLEKVREDDKS